MGTGPGHGLNFGSTEGSNNEQTKKDSILSLASTIKKLNYYRNELPATAPIKIPKTAQIIVQDKTKYKQVKYKWYEKDVRYEVRWHTKTPRSPSYEKDSWVVERHIKGKGYGKNSHIGKDEILVGKKWISKDEWTNAIRAKNTNKATKKQKELLKNGHFKCKK